MSNALVVVMSTPELLELTLSHLPMRDLLVTAPLVSKTWQALTLTPALQRALFFQPDPSSLSVHNPLLVELSRPSSLCRKARTAGRGRTPSPSA
ncbi:hypothetical protein DFH08DRAFT_865784 [Mycena albidolilacea]|uniref:F-box domain-containing protein n=1 Tax=Mycena albidolilacea TaxID=1033008 RepID=A0AAD7A2L8_9AGAR|nr:hypothetical protein DFH08DRAFT_865784 [Mycena albidolilacea]